MNTILKMTYQGKVETFKVTYKCDAYIFCECISNPAARGFFTNQFVQNNKAA